MVNNNKYPLEVFIPGSTPSSKNSKIKGKFFSKTVQNYLKSFGIRTFSSRLKEVVTYKNVKLTYPVKELKALFAQQPMPPYKLGYHFIRRTKHRADFNNLTQLTNDLLTAFNIIQDDDMDHLLPYPYLINGSAYSYNKENPGLILKLFSDEFVNPF